MNIIFGDAVNNLPQELTVLELDTINLIPANKKIKTYCIIEQMSLDELALLEDNKSNHAILIDQYRQKNWEGCRKLLTSLKGCWNGEIDSFYEELENRISELEKSPPAADWDGCLVRNS